MNLKIKVCRSSGLPVQLSHIDSFQDEYKVIYDKILNKYHNGQDKIMDAAKAERMGRILTRLEKGLHKKYPNTSEWDFFATPESWSEAVRKYGPIAVARNRDTGDLTFVIMDTDF